MELIVIVNERLSVPLSVLSFAAYMLSTIQLAVSGAQELGVDPSMRVKVAAIKLLRAMPGQSYGLADSKHIMEFALEHKDAILELSRVNGMYSL